MKVPFARPDITEAEVKAASEALASGWLTSGPRVTEFEVAFGKACGEGCIAVAVSSATAGLELAARAHRLEGKRVALPVWTFTSTASALLSAGAIPGFQDIDPRTLHMADTDFAASMPVHLAGMRCIAPQSAVVVIEDAAHCLPYDPGEATAVFSLYATKPIAAGEGGVVVTRSGLIAERIHRMRAHGFDEEVFDRHQSGHRAHQVIERGFKYNFNDVGAAIALTQLERRKEMRARRFGLYSRYREHLRGCILPPTEMADSSLHLFIVMVPERDAFIEMMRNAGIACGVHYLPLHLHDFWREKYNLRYDSFPNANAANRQAVSLPFWSGMTNEQQDEVIKAVRDILC